jgi:hypothetical protein
MQRSVVIFAVWVLLLIGTNGSPHAAEQSKSDALPSWNENASKNSIVDFVERVTRRNR